MYVIFPLVPAYGRDYKTKDDVLAGWNAGNGFRCSNGQYCSKRDFLAGTRITVRYDKLSKVMTFTVAD